MTLAGFLLRSVIAGLAVAFVLVFLWPSLRDRLNGEPAPTPVPAVAPAEPYSYADAVNRAAPSVVSLYTRRLEIQQVSPFIQQVRSRLDMGSGVLVSADGYILTNDHVIRNVGDIGVALWDGRLAPARLIGSDPPTDLAVLKIDLEGLPAAPLAPDTEIRVGDVVLAIGNALGLSHTVTMGIVSATGRDLLQNAIYQDFIQTDAAINAGNSGGALINARGEVIGISNRNLGRATGAQNIGFAIPMRVASTVMNEIIESGAVRRAWIGAQFSDLSLVLKPDGRPMSRGIQVREVTPNGPAWLGGIREGDTLLSLDGAPIEDAREFLLEIARREPGSQVELEVLRDEQRFATYATLKQQPPVR